MTQLVGVTLTGAAVNPARAFGPAVFEGGVALRQLWVFIVFPLLGGALAALVAPLVMGAQRHYWGGHEKSVGRPDVAQRQYLRPRPFSGEYPS